MGCMYVVTFLVWYTVRKSFIHALASDSKSSIWSLERDWECRVKFSLKNCFQISWITSIFGKLGNRTIRLMLLNSVLFGTIQIPPFQLLWLLTLVKMKWNVAHAALAVSPISIIVKPKVTYSLLPIHVPSLVSLTQTSLLSCKSESSKFDSTKCSISFFLNDCCTPIVPSVVILLSFFYLACSRKQRVRLSSW